MPDNDSLNTENTTSRLNLEHSRRINFFCQCNNPVFETVLEQLLDELRDFYLTSGGAPNGFRQENNLNMLRRFIADLHVCHIGDPTRWLSVPFGRNYYFNETRYQPLFGVHSAACRVRDFLAQRGYIVLVVGFEDPRSSIRRLTRMRATQRLVELLNGISTLDYSTRVETVELKDSAKQLIEYEDNDLTNRIRGDLEIINDLISNSWIDLRVSNITFLQICSERIIELSRNTLKRVFNNSSFEQGGRFYGGWWLEIPKQYRPYITIDGAETVELDYSSMHLAILYIHAGLSLPDGDLYLIDGYPREIVKTVFTRSVNCNSRSDAVNSILNSIRKEIRKAERAIRKATTEEERQIAVNKRTEIIEYTSEQLLEVAFRFENLHSQIASALYQGTGLELQNLDSRIANLLMLRLSEANIVALPVHDSFIVKREHEQRLLQMMITCFRTLTDGSVTVPLPNVAPRVEIDFDSHFDEYSMYYERRIDNEQFN